MPTNPFKRGEVLRDLRAQLAAEKARNATQRAELILLDERHATEQASIHRLSHDLTQALAVAAFHAIWLPLLEQALQALAQGAEESTVLYDGTEFGLGKIDVTFHPRAA